MKTREFISKLIYAVYTGVNNFNINNVVFRLAFIVEVNNIMCQILCEVLEPSVNPSLMLARVYCAYIMR